MRASTFESVAAQSAGDWPEYPAEAVRWLIGGDGKPVRVLELGAGTGKLTRTLRALGHEVIAIDPSSAMLAQLLKVAPDGHIALARAEDIPLPPA
ncbi:MAG: class I SAM-dependent methyltransferase, partial [Nocardioidaceae bacterium]|nr:class I SAM-dependent methyltransferase [Nocardioidaceae bacterium]